MNAGILVVKRIHYFTDNRYSPPDRTSSTRELHEDVLRRYRGIDGEWWPDLKESDCVSLENGLAPLSHYEEVLKYYGACEQLGWCEFIYLNPGRDDAKPVSGNKELKFCGYDYGYYGSELDVYSVIFHEVIYGRHEELRKFGVKLNENLLLPSLLEVDELEKSRNQLLIAGEDLESGVDGELYAPIGVYTFRRTDY